MKYNPQHTTHFLAGALFLALAALQIGATHSHTPTAQTDIQYSTFGYGPSIILLHNSSRSDRDWTDSAKYLAQRFRVTLLDISDIASDTHAAEKLRQIIKRLGVTDVRISGSAHGEALARRYALAFPFQARSFALPHNCEDLESLALLFTTNLFTKS